jgi:hypothetical protein
LFWVRSGLGKVNNSSGKILKLYYKGKDNKSVLRERSMHGVSRSIGTKGLGEIFVKTYGVMTEMRGVSRSHNRVSLSSKLHVTVFPP